MSQSKELVLKYEDETYSLLEVPESTSKLVVLAKQRMMQTINLPQLARDLSNLGMLLRLAFNGVVGFIDLQTKVRKVFYDVVTLCDESVHTINEFQRASNTAVVSLQATYEYLVEGLDDLAIINLEEIATVASKMKVAADKLSKEFQDEANIVQSLEEEVTREEDKTKRSSEEKEKQRKEEERKKEEEDKRFKDMVQDEMEAEKNYEAARKKEIEEINNQKLGFLKGVVNAVTTNPFTGKGAFDSDVQAAKNKAEVYGKEKEMFYKQMIEAKVQRRLALQKIASFAKRMEQLGNDSILEAAAAESLHHAASALVSLAVIMKNTSRFWEETEGLCQELSSPKMVKEIKAVSKLDDEKRKKVWDRETFKLGGIMYYCSWIAIKEICETCRGGVEDAQRSVHAYIRENPTKEQARLNVKQLAPKLDAVVKQDIAIILIERTLL